MLYMCLGRLPSVTLMTSSQTSAIADLQRALRQHQDPTPLKTNDNVYEQCSLSASTGLHGNKSR